MNKFAAKEYLSQAYHIDRQIDSKLEQLHSLRALAFKASDTSTEQVVSGSRNVRRMEDIIAKIVDFESEINDDIDALVDLKREIFTFIKRVKNPEYQLILELRYLCFKKWEHIAEKLEYELRYVFKLHSHALEICNNNFSHGK